MLQKRKLTTWETDLKNCFDDCGRTIKFPRKFILPLPVTLKYAIYRNKEELSRDSLADATLVVLGAPREEFTATEAQELTQWVNGGGRVLLMTTDNGDDDENVNLQNFLSG